MSGRAESRPGIGQGATGEKILADIQEERRWNASFDRSADILADMASEALEEYRTGRTLPLDLDRM